jgi:ribosomal protein L19E
MATLHPQFMSYINGNQVSVIPAIHEYNGVVKELEDVENAFYSKLYQEAKAENTGERTSLSDYLARRNNNHN